MGLSYDGAPDKHQMRLVVYTMGSLVDGGTLDQLRNKWWGYRSAAKQWEAYKKQEKANQDMYERMAREATASTNRAKEDWAARVRARLHMGA